MKRVLFSVSLYIHNIKLTLTPAAHLCLAETHWITSPPDSCIKAALSESKHHSVQEAPVHLASPPALQRFIKARIRKDLRCGFMASSNTAFSEGTLKRETGHISTSHHFTAAFCCSRSGLSDQFVDASVPGLVTQFSDHGPWMTAWQAGGGNGWSAWEPHSRRMTAL